jgi:superfamily II DNA or RNA helicase
VAKLVPILNVRPSAAKLGRCELRYHYHPGLKDELKGDPVVPGVAWDADSKVWYYPSEMVETHLARAAKAYGYTVKNDLVTPELDLTKTNFHANTRAFQEWPILKAAAYGRWIFNLDTGLGKSCCAIQALRLREAKHILIVCPANVKLSWCDELDKWWPVHPEARIIENGKDTATATEDGIYIVSYNLLEKMPLRHLDAIVFDEGHYLKDARSSRSKEAAALVEQHPTSAVFLLTATPICDRPIDIWHQGHVLWPGRLGTYWQFAFRYCAIEENEYGIRVIGAHDERAPELAARLAHFSSRVTKHEVADQLPAFDVFTVRVRAKRKLNHREFIDSLAHNNWREHTMRLDAACTKAGAEKFDSVVEFALSDLECASHVCVLTHFKDSAHEIANRLAKELGETCPVIHIDGELGTSARHRAINEAVALPKCVLVATMHSVAEGINNLIKFTRATFAELYWQPKTMAQTLGRFSRLSSTEKSSARIVVLEGSLDEVIASSLMQKLGEAQKIVRAGMAEEKLDTALENRMSEEDFFAEMQRAASSMFEEEI